MDLDQQNYPGIRKIGRFYASSFIQMVVQEIDQGLSIIEASVRHGVKSQTIHHWLDKFKPSDYQKRRRKRFTPANRRSACRAVWSAKLTKYEVAENYGVTVRAVELWLKQEKDELNDLIPDDLKKIKKSDSSTELDEVKLLQQQLQEAKLKIAALNKLIDVAEEQLKIDIRKKPGAKQ